MIFRFIGSLVEAVFAIGPAFTSTFASTWKSYGQPLPNKSVFATLEAEAAKVKTEVVEHVKEGELLVENAVHAAEVAGSNALKHIADALAPDVQHVEQEVTADTAVAEAVVEDVKSAAKVIQYEFKPKG